MKPLRFSKHAQEQCVERGTTEAEVREAILRGAREPAKLGRELCRYNLVYNRMWQGKFYAIKQIAPVIKEGEREIIVITVYAFYF
jgi:hypothetical protein